MSSALLATRSAAAPYAPAKPSLQVAPQVEISLASYQLAALCSPFQHTCLYGGVGIGKTFIGAHFVIDRIRRFPDCTGLVGANTYNQLSQATLRELFYWLDFYGFEYVVDQRPPRAWGVSQKAFKSYENILSVRYRDKVVTIFVRVMSDEGPLRGIEISWYYIDEGAVGMRQLTHDVVLSRMRETEHIKGLVTTTTNGEGWDHTRFVRGPRPLYGSMHVGIKEAVRLGIRTEEYERMLRASYSPLVAAQECDAEHVNILGGRAYYASGVWNRLYAAPWGDIYPSVDRPLIVACDFNYSPAPCVWIVGQVGPPLFGPRGEYWPEHIHWFAEISKTEASTPEMCSSVLSRYPGFFYEVYGDASGNRGQTSNAGETDFKQIANTMIQAGVGYSIDVDQGNPPVKDRVEAMNAKFKNGIGQVTQTFDPNNCPLLDGDCRTVGWKATGKLDPGKDSSSPGQTINHLRTHASDAAGYFVFKRFPPLGLVRRSNDVNVTSPHLAGLAGVL